MKIDIENSKYAKKAMDLFLEGYNCSQAVFLAFADKYDMDKTMALKLSSSFGGGMGRLREVCGAVSGMFMVFGFIKGYSEADNFDGKKELYEHIQELGHRFEKENGSIICRELLGLEVKHDDPTPEKRTESYYKKRSCEECVGSAAEILEAYLTELGV